jgi:hypothetical protein
MLLPRDTRRSRRKLFHKCREQVGWIIIGSVFEGKDPIVSELPTGAGTGSAPTPKTVVAGAAMSDLKVRPPKQQGRVAAKNYDADDQRGTRRAQRTDA